MKNVESLMEKNAELFKQAYNEKIQIWFDHVFLTWRWWIGVTVIIICLLIWFWLRKQGSADRLFYAGFFTSIFAVILNLTGMSLGLWEYRYEFIPVAVYIPWDIFLIPTVVMLLLLFKPHINPWIKAVFLGLISSLGGLPILSSLGLYEIMNCTFILFPS
jgi:hypothetical protein